MKNKIPKLRFKEFTEEWEEKRLDKLGFVGRGKSKHRPRNDKILFGGPYPFIQTGDIKKANLFLKDFSQTYSEFGLNQSKLWSKGTLCITIAANIAETSILDIDACFPDSIIGINTFSEKSNTIFLKNYFDFLRKSFERLAEGLAQDNLNLEKLLSINFKIPSLQEQEKIANFLSSVDTKIEMLEKKKELLSDYKKGMMQKLFSQNLRFKDENGNDYPEWEEKRFKELTYLITKQTGFDYSKTIKPSLITEKKDNNVPFIQNKDFSPTKINLDTDFYIPKIIQEKFPKITLDEKCLLITISGNIGNIGVFDKLEIAFIGGAVGIIKFNDKNIIDYIKHYLTCSEGQKMIKKEIKSSSHQNITIEGIREFKITLPSLQEQEKIANFLSSIDKKIELVEGELEKNKEFKKGLLQQMFV